MGFRHVSLMHNRLWCGNIEVAGKGGIIEALQNGFLRRVLGVENAGLYDKRGTSKR